MAAKAATDFSDTVYDKTKDVFYNIKETAAAQKKCGEIFANYAKTTNKKVFKPDWIYDGETNIKGLGNEPELAKTVSSLFIDNPVSETIKGNKATFVALLTAKQGPQPETYEKQKSKIIADLKQSKALNLAKEKARESALKISEALDKGEKFASITKKLNIIFKPVPQELKVSMPLFIPNGYIIQDAAFESSQGELAPVKNTQDGAILVYVVKKSFPTDKEYDTQKAMFTTRYKMMKQQTVWRDFTATLAAASAPAGKNEKKPE